MTNNSQECSESNKAQDRKLECRKYETLHPRENSECNKRRGYTTVDILNQKEWEGLKEPVDLDKTTE
jgi:hypothetical protein